VTAEFDGRVALIAGASRGIGAGTAEAWAQAGAAVVIAARSSEALDQVAARITDAGGRALAVPTDVTDPTAMRELVERTLAAYGRLDFAFNNATGGPMPAPLADIEIDGFDAGIAANVRGTFLGMKYQIPAMLAGGGGAIVNMASVAAVRATANLGAYVAGKSAIIGLTEVAALDYADRGVRVNVVAPGHVDTPMIRNPDPEAHRAALLTRGAQAALNRVGQPEEVANTVLFLTSAESSFINGSVISIDGGRAYH